MAADSKKALEVYQACIKDNTGSLVLASDDSYCVNAAKEYDKSFVSPLFAPPPATPESDKKPFPVWAIILIMLLIIAAIWYFFFR